MTENWIEVQRQHIDQPVSIKLERGQKGNYGWEIKVYDESPRVALLYISETDQYLREHYGGDNVDPKRSSE